MHTETAAAAVLTAAPLPIVYTEAATAAILTPAPVTLVFAEAAAAAVLAQTPLPLVFADAAAAAVLTQAPPPLVFAEAATAAVPALAPLPIVFAATLCTSACFALHARPFLWCSCCSAAWLAVGLSLLFRCVTGHCCSAARPGCNTDWFAMEIGNPVRHLALDDISVL